MTDTITAWPASAPEAKPKRKRRLRASTIILSATLIATTATLSVWVVGLSNANAEAAAALTTAQDDLATSESELGDATRDLALANGDTAQAQAQADVCKAVVIELKDQLGVMINDVVIPLQEGAKLGALNQFAAGSEKLNGSTAALNGLTTRITDVGPDYRTCVA